MKTVRRSGGQAVRTVARSGGQAVSAALVLVFLAAWPPDRLTAQASRNWRPEDRALLTDLSYVTAVAATRSVVYAATPNGLAVYDRAVRSWRQTVGPLDGFPGGIVTAMAADPSDDLAWMGANSQWLAYDPFSRRLDTGALPGLVDQVVLDAADPARGAYFHTSAGWYFVGRGALVAAPARDLPAPGSRIGGMTERELLGHLPALDAVRLRIERDDQMRTFRLTSAAVAPLTSEIVVGTDGNGAFRVDPVTYAADRFPAGLLGSSAGAVASSRGQICAAGEARTGSPHRGIACFDERASGFTYFEFGVAGFAGAVVRRLLVTERAVWAATDQGLLRVPRRGGRMVQVLTRDGLPSDRIYALAAAPAGAYVGTGGGLAVVTDTGRGVVVVETAQGPPVLALAASGADTVWAGTAAGVVAFLLPLGGPVSVPAGPGPLHDPVVALAIRGDTIVAATESRFLVRTGGEWRVVEPPGQPIGRLVSVVADEAGWWAAGDQGFAFFDPVRPRWNALVLPATFRCRCATSRRAATRCGWRPTPAWSATTNGCWFREPPRPGA